MSKRMNSKFRICLAYVRNEYYNLCVYRSAFWMRMAYTCLMMHTVGYVWKALYASGLGTMEVGINQVITYAVLGVALDSIMNPAFGPQVYIAEQVRKGTIEIDILRPIDLQFQMFAKNIGSIVVRLCIYVVPSLVIAHHLFGLLIPGLINMSAFALSLMLAILVNFLLNFLLGLFSMMTMNIRNIIWGYNATHRFFSGQMVPLWLFPGLLGIVGKCLPFQCVYAIPMSIYISDYRDISLLSTLGVQSLWVVGLLILSRLLMKRVFTNLMIQGG